MLLANGYHNPRMPIQSNVSIYHDPELEELKKISCQKEDKIYMSQKDEDSQGKKIQ